MDIYWQNSIEIDRPVAEVYAYLVDFTRHPEWAQTLVKLEQIKPGGLHGVGAKYKTTERQAFQNDRKPYEVLRKGMPAITLCEILLVEPEKRIVWQAHMLPKTGLRADLSFDFTPTAVDRTRLSQSYHLYQPGWLAQLFKLIFGRNLEAKAHAQADASLDNIKAILQGSNGRYAPKQPDLVATI